MKSRIIDALKWMGIVAFIGIAIVSFQWDYRVGEPTTTSGSSIPTPSLEESIPQPYLATVSSVIYDANYNAISALVIDQEGVGKEWVIENSEEFGSTDGNPSFTSGMRVQVTPITEEMAYFHVFNVTNTAVSGLEEIKQVLSMNVDYSILGKDELETFYGWDEYGLKNAFGIYSIHADDATTIIFTDGSVEAVQNDYDMIIDSVKASLNQEGMDKDYICFITTSDEVSVLSITTREMFDEIKDYYELYLKNFDENDPSIFFNLFDGGNEN